MEQTYTGRVLSFVKFLVKYSDFTATSAWLARLLDNPAGQEKEEMNCFVDQHNLRDKMNQYHESIVEKHHHHRRRHAWAFCPLHLNLSLWKLRRKLLKPREYWRRQTEWHALLMGVCETKLLTSVGGQGGHGYEIHACPAMLDLTKKISASSQAMALCKSLGFCGPKISRKFKLPSFF